jgi:Neprosin
MQLPRKSYLIVPLAAGFAILCWMSCAANASEAAPDDESTRTGGPQDTVSPAVTCVDRPKGVRPPPKRLAPILRPRREKEPGDDKPGKEDAQELTRPVVSRLGFKPVCLRGKVPVIKPRPTKVGKGNPLFAADPNAEYLKYEGRARAEFFLRHLRSFEDVYERPRKEGENPPPPPPPPAPPCDGVAWYGSCYYYGSAAFSTAADGGGMTNSIEKPAYVNTGGEGHSLNEIAVQGGASNGDIIEMGWFVDSEMEGNVNPHIFVYHWINGAETCYDTCGWQQWSSTYHPGMDLGSAGGKKVYIGYVLYQRNWWAWFDDQWMGYFPGSEWNGQYTKTSLIQWFGEVASANGIPPKTQMGNGQFPSSTNAASMATLCDVDAKAWVCWYRDQQGLSRTVAKYYDISRVAFGATTYGGPGQ